MSKMPRQTQSMVLEKFRTVFYDPFMLEVAKFRAGQDKDYVHVLPPLTLTDLDHYNAHMKSWHNELVQLSMSTLRLEVEKLLYKYAPLAHVEADHPFNRHVLDGPPSSKPKLAETATDLDTAISWYNRAHKHLTQRMSFLTATTPTSPRCGRGGARTGSRKRWA